MEYEIHVTVQTPHMLTFINDCHQMGVKPIVIETQKNDCFDNQVMTSSKHKGDDYMITLHSICDQLKEKGYHIIRQKVEIRPQVMKDPNHIYYESHLRLKLNRDFDRSILYDLCKQLDFHLSKNLFKKDTEFDYQMITYRKYNMSFDNFIMGIEKMKQKLIEINVIFDKVEIEECVYDSNVKVDANWI